MATASVGPAPPAKPASRWVSPLVRVVEETPTVRSFWFDRPPGAFSFRPGQYLSIRQPGLKDPRGESRTFSISSAPSEPGAIAFTTRAGPSPFKERLFAATPGTEFPLTAPFGRFVRESERPAVLIGGGIGVTPFRSMIREAAESGSTVPIRLLYGSRIPEEIVYRTEFESLAARWDAFRCVFLVSRPSESSVAWEGRTGHVDPDLVRAETEGLPEPLYYVCGPPAMVTELREMLLREVGVSDSVLRIESFTGY